MRPAPDPDAGLAPFAARQATSKGRLYPEPAHPYRGEYQRDRDRIIHSTAFRRLVYKTQVFVNHEGDLYRTRLTHSLEVAQIARTVANTLRLNEQLVEAICLAHDLGHTPFGHAGQDSLNKCMQSYGGFEHNLQSLRTVDLLEDTYADFKGLNLSFETREGILKHCSKRNARELGELGQRFLKSEQPGLEAQLANLADEIAYNNHDVDDGLRAGLLSIDDLCGISLFGEHYENVQRNKPEIEQRALIHETVRSMINTIVTDLLHATESRLNAADPGSIDAVRTQPQRLVGFSDAVLEQHQELKQFLKKALYKHPRVMEMTDRANRVVAGLFELYFADPDKMSAEHAVRAKNAGADLNGDTGSGVSEEQANWGRARVVADYVAGMTDRYALSAYKNHIDNGLEL